MMRSGERGASEPGATSSQRGRGSSRHYVNPDSRYHHRNGSGDGRNSHPNGVEEEGVEVVLDAQVTKVMDDSPPQPRSRAHPGQNVFRAPPSSSHAVRPRAVRPPGGGPPMPPVMGSGSFGYGPPPPRGEYPPYPVPHNPSGSFDEGHYHHSQQQHYSPHVQYPRGGHYSSEDVNVISPPHGKGDKRPPRTSSQSKPPPPHQYYQYPPTSPVSRPAAPRSSSPRRHYGSSRPPEGPYSAAQRKEPPYHPEDGTWNSFPPASSSGSQPPLVTESSFDSEPHSHYSHPPTPGGYPPTPGSLPPSYDPQQQFYGGGGSWGSFDSGAPPPHFDDQRYYGYPPNSPYPPYSPGPGYYGEPYAAYPYGPPQPSYDQDDRGVMMEYHPEDRDAYNAATVTPGDNRKNSSPHTDSTPVQSNKSESGMLLPQAAYEVDFEVTSPPPEPVMPPSTYPVCSTPAEINEDDVLCGRGGGTNSQIGNRRFRKLVQEFQPTYLLARRKEKPLLARTIVLIIRKRGGRFLKKNDDTGELYEVGDAKAEAKTSQALREGLDVRATKSAANSLLDKKKKKKKGKGADKDKESEEKDKAAKDKEEKPKEEVAVKKEDQERAKTPPPQLPALKEGESMSGIVHPHSPDALQFRKRRRMRSKEGAVQPEDKLFPDFCPPRADLHRTASPDPEDGPTPMNLATTPPAGNATATVEEPENSGGCQPGCQPGCAGIAMEMVLGAATGGFCLGPKWRGGDGESS